MRDVSSAVIRSVEVPVATGARPGGRVPVPGELAGLALVALLVGAAFAAGAVVPGLNPVVCAMGAGVFAAPFARRHPAVGPGVQLAARPLMRAGVALLGLRISLGDVAALGLRGVVLAAGTLVTTYALTLWLGRRLGVQRDACVLIAAGTAVCGAAAIAAMRSVTRAGEEQVAHAVATVTLFGTVAMLAIPVAGTQLLGLGDQATGLWAGASIHEVAQVTGAGAAISVAALQAATLVKLVRVVLLAPLAAFAGRRADGAGTPGVPGFVLMFLALVLVRTVLPVPAQVLDAALLASAALLAAGLAALGLQLRWSAVRAAGVRPLLLGLGATVVATGTGLALVLALGL